LRGRPESREDPIAALKHAQPGTAARALVDFMLSPAGQAFLKARGFAAP
jgi:ABC-type Fe3+ transport system substrate-binding protein